mgnify:CR=1 FL=1
MATRQIEEYHQWLVEQEKEKARIHLVGPPRSASAQLIRKLKGQGILEAQGDARRHDADEAGGGLRPDGAQ